jgi:hypothetical protein
MQSTSRLTIAAIALLSSVSVAAAAGNGTSKSAATGAGSTSISQPMTKDLLSLTGPEQKTAWKDITGQATKEKAPAGFTPSVGTVVPSDITTHPVPVSTASKVPSLRPYQYAWLDSNKLLIINPSDKKIAEIVTQ